DASGARLWTPDGNLVASGTTSSVVPDGAGGAVVAWQSNGDIFVQRLDAAETPQWGVSGVQLSATTQFDGAPGLAADGTGGTFVVWQSVSGPSSIDLLGQHVDASGGTHWPPNGAPVAVSDGPLVSYFAIADGLGGAIVPWAAMNADHSIHTLKLQKI